MSQAKRAGPSRARPSLSPGWQSSLWRNGPTSLGQRVRQTRDVRLSKGRSTSRTTSRATSRNLQLR
eukprot:7627546-Pyramimonas_sp.AAC.1